MSSFQHRPHRDSQESGAPHPEDLQPWRMVPPPRRDQRPLPGKRSPQPGYVLPDPPLDETAALRHQLTAARRPPGQPAAPAPAKRPFINGWTWGALLAIMGLGGIAGASAVSLLRLPNLPNCRAIFWPTASATTRLQCADAYGEQATVDNLLAAIELVEALPSDHPLRADINARVETWAGQILTLADAAFQAGDLDEATRIARRIPRGTAAADEVSDRLSAWNDTWEQAESIFKESENHLKASRFREAFSAATQLRSVENDYWSTTRYEALIALITTTREDVNAIANAERLAENGTVEQILEALEQVKAIAEESYAYAEAQRLLQRLGRDLLDLAEDALARQDRSQATNILSKIPPEAELQDEVADFQTLVEAYELTWAGTTVGYESAIGRLQSLGEGRPLYGRAQSLRRRWQQQLEALAQLNWAKQIAQPGSVDALRAAITEAETIGAASPFWEETQDQIDQWQRDIAEVEDRPFLDRGQVIASQGDRASLQAAISEAENILPGSALYDEAREAIADWRWQVETMDNEPVLAEAQQLAETGRLEQAIAVASRIPANQAFYEDAQAAIAAWETQQQETQQYQQAVLVSQTGTVNALEEAITLAQAIPKANPDWADAQAAASQWSWDLLEIAQTAAIQDPTLGISIAARIPPRTEAYAEAQLSIRDWQRAELVNQTQ